MNERTGMRRLPPLFKTEAQVIKCDAVDIKTFAVGSEDSNELWREVQHLTELHFTSAQFFLCSFTLSDVDHSANKFNELARRAQNRMSNDVNVPDSAIRMHDAVVCLELCLLADRRLGQFPEPGSVIRMNLLKEVFAVGQAIGWIETQNTITLLRPVTGSTSRGAPGPTAGLAHLLRFRQVPLTAPEVFLGRLALCDVGHRADNFFVACLVSQATCKIMKMFYRTVRHQQPMLQVKVTSALRRTLKNVFEKVDIVRMRSLQYQIGRWFRPGWISVNPSRFLGPEYALGTYFHSDTTGATESLRIC